MISNLPLKHVRIAPTPKSPYNIFIMFNTVSCNSLSEILKSKLLSSKVFNWAIMYLKN